MMTRLRACRSMWETTKPGVYGQDRGRVVGIGVLIELEALGGRARVGDYRLESLTTY